jgi:hypothetical protein
MFPGLLPRTRWWARRREYGFDLLVEEDEYRKMLATYKIRNIIPPGFWQPLPYNLDGRSFAEYTGITARFQADLAREGIVINVSDDIVLLVDLLRKNLPSFKNFHRELFFTLDAAALGRLVAEANMSIGS